MKQVSLYPKEILQYLALSGIPRGPESHIYVADSVHGSDSNSGDRWTKPLLTLEAAEDLCVTGHNDVVLLINSATAYGLADALTWDKNLTHLIGMSAETLAGKRTRITPDADEDTMITVSGYGCVFKNIRISHEYNAATSLTAVKVTGPRNYFENVEFIGNVYVAQAIDGGCSLRIANNGAECLFKHCMIGTDATISATGLMAMVIDAAAPPARNRFEDCHFAGYAGSTAAGLVEFLGTSCQRAWVFDRCEFINVNTDFAMAGCFVVPAGWDSRYGGVFLKDCVGFGFTDWEPRDVGAVRIASGVITGATGGNAGLFQTAEST